MNGEISISMIDIEYLPLLTRLHHFNITYISNWKSLRPCLVVALYHFLKFSYNRLFEWGEIGQKSISYKVKGVTNHYSLPPFVTKYWFYRGNNSMVSAIQMMPKAVKTIFHTYWSWGGSCCREILNIIWWEDVWWLAQPNIAR